MTSKHSPSLNLKTHISCPESKIVIPEQLTHRLFWIACVRIFLFAQVLLRTGRATFTQQGHSHDIVSDRSMWTSAWNKQNILTYFIDILWEISREICEYR